MLQTIDRPILNNLQIISFIFLILHILFYFIPEENENEEIYWFYSIVIFIILHLIVLLSNIARHIYFCAYFFGYIVTNILFIINTFKNRRIYSIDKKYIIMWLNFSSHVLYLVAVNKMKGIAVVSGSNNLCN